MNRPRPPTYFVTTPGTLSQRIRDVLCQAGCKIVPHHNCCIDILAPDGTEIEPFKPDKLEDVYTVTFPDGTKVAQCYDKRTHLSVIVLCQDV